MRQDIPPEYRESRPDADPPQEEPKRIEGPASDPCESRVDAERMGQDRESHNEAPVTEGSPIECLERRLSQIQWSKWIIRAGIPILVAIITATAVIVAPLISRQPPGTIIIPQSPPSKSADSTIGPSTPVSNPAPVPATKRGEESREAPMPHAPNSSLPEMIKVSEERFRIARCEVSNEQYGAFWLENPEHRPLYYDSPDFNHPSQPVVGVSWYDAAAYCNWLSMKRKETYRLPKKEEWDRAAEYSGANRYPGGENEIDKQRVNIGKDKTHPLAVDRPEAEETRLGIKDMSGNVAEWCQDETSDGKRVVRGGSWASEFRDAAYYSSNAYPPGIKKNDLGFRVVELDPERQ